MFEEFARKFKNMYIDFAEGHPLRFDEECFSYFGKKIKTLYIDFDIDENVSFEENHWSYKDDLFQISYEKNYTLDIGWYPDHNPKGSFKIVVIKDYDWDKPVLMKRCKKVKTLVKYLEKFIAYVQKEIAD